MADNSLPIVPSQPKPQHELSNTTPLDRLIDLKELLRTVPYSRTAIYKKVADGSFPAPLKLSGAPGDRCGARIAWKESEVREWINSHPRAA